MRTADADQVKEWQEAMLTTYRETGSVAVSCERVGIPTIRHKRWVKSDADYASAMAQITTDRRQVGLKSGRELATGRPVDVMQRREQQDRLLGFFARIGLLDRASKESGVAFKNHYRWMEDDPEYARRFVTLKNEVEANGVASSNRLPRGPHTPEQIERSRAAALARHAAMTPEQREAHRAGLRKANAHIKGGKVVTQLEAAVLMVLNACLVPYFVHFGVGGYTADVYVPSLRLDIEADGSAFHNEDTAEREAERDAALAAVGVTVLRLTEAEIEAGDWSRLHAALEAR